MDVEPFYKCTLFSVLCFNKLTLVSKLETFCLMSSRTVCCVTVPHHLARAEVSGR